MAQGTDIGLKLLGVFLCWGAEKPGTPPWAPSWWFPELNHPPGPTVHPVPRSTLAHLGPPQGFSSPAPPSFFLFFYFFFFLFFHFLFLFFFFFVLLLLLLLLSL